MTKAVTTVETMDTQTGAVSTTAARQALPTEVSHRDAAFNVGRAGLLLGALATGEYGLLDVAMQDRLHQNYRAHLIPGLEAVISAAHDTGAYGSCLSGSGPTVLAFVPEDRAAKVARAMRAAFEKQEVKTRAWALDINLGGAQTEPVGAGGLADLEPEL